MGLLRMARNVSFVLWGSSLVLLLTAVVMVLNTHGASGALDLAGTFLAVFFIVLALLLAIVGAVVFATQRAIRRVRDHALPRGG